MHVDKVNVVYMTIIIIIDKLNAGGGTGTERGLSIERTDYCAHTIHMHVGTLSTDHVNVVPAQTKHAHAVRCTKWLCLSRGSA